MSVSSNTTLLIVVPTLNSFSILPRLVCSLKEQTWPFWNLLFVDGPSTPEHRCWLENTCSSDPRFSWVPQDPAVPGIYAAMNQGFILGSSYDWILFWGSDDWAASPSALEDILSHHIENSSLVISRGRYSNAMTGQLGRCSSFYHSASFDSAAFRFLLRAGRTPPHQATLFGRLARKYLSHYCTSYRLSADLDYFLSLSRFPELTITCLDVVLVHMGDAGVSGKETRLRLSEVKRAYSSAFSFCWPVTYALRYVYRFFSLLINF